MGSLFSADILEKSAQQAETSKVNSEDGKVGEFYCVQRIYVIGLLS